MRFASIGPGTMMAVALILVAVGGGVFVYLASFLRINREDHSERIVVKLAANTSQPNSLEQRGMRLFLFLATLIILPKLVEVAEALCDDLAEVNWLTSVAIPLVFVMAVVFMWQGQVWLQWVLGVCCAVYGAVLWLVSLIVLVKLGVHPPEETEASEQFTRYTIDIMLSIGHGMSGLLHMMAGFVFLFSPSMRAFFQYQRQRYQRRRRARFL
jgi:hypothetical protein